MFEFGVEDKKSLTEIVGEKKGMGSKPLLLFIGDQWENDNLYKSIQNLFIDYFRGDKADKISLKGVDHAIGFSCVDGKIHLRAYTLGYQKSDTKVRHCSALGLELSFPCSVGDHLCHVGAKCFTESHGSLLRLDGAAVAAAFS